MFSFACFVWSRDINQGTTANWQVETHQEQISEMQPHAQLITPQNN
jgi:hypothetical protein